MLNLFIGVVVNAIQVEHDAELRESQEEASRHLDDQHTLTREMLGAEIAQLREEIRRLAARVDPEQ